MDPQGFLWILDPAAPGNAFNLDGGPKLVKVDLGSDKVVQVIRFGRDTIPQGSYLNDVRVSPDGRWAYITDSGVRGALLVVDLRTGKPRRVLDGHPSTQVEPGVIVHADRQELRRPDKREVKFSADGIALDRQGRFLYWQALTGRTLYRLPTSILTDPTVAPAQLAAAVTKVGTTGVADGLWMDGKGNIWVTSPEEDALKLRAPDGMMQTVVQDKRLRWPDSLAEGPDGSIYVTSSQIQDMAQWHEKGSTRTQSYALWRVAGSVGCLLPFPPGEGRGEEVLRHGLGRPRALVPRDWWCPAPQPRPPYPGPLPEGEGAEDQPASSAASRSRARRAAGRLPTRRTYSAISDRSGISLNAVVQPSAVPHSTSAALKRMPNKYGPGLMADTMVSSTVSNSP